MPRWAIPQDELETLPGYRSDKAAVTRTSPRRRALWAAANGPSSSITVLFAGVPAYIPQQGAARSSSASCRKSLGLDVEETVDPTGYTDSRRRFCTTRPTQSEGTCAVHVGLRQRLDRPRRLALPVLPHGRRPRTRSCCPTPTLDTLLDAQRAEFDYESRRDKGYEIQRYLLEKTFARLDYAAPIGRFAQWNYVRNAYTATWFGHRYFEADMWLDKDDPSFSGRPT